MDIGCWVLAPRDNLRLRLWLHLTTAPGGYRGDLNLKEAEEQAERGRETGRGTDNWTDSIRFRAGELSSLSSSSNANQTREPQKPEKNQLPGWRGDCGCGLFLIRIVHACSAVEVEPQLPISMGVVCCVATYCIVSTYLYILACSSKRPWTRCMRADIPRLSGEERLRVPTPGICNLISRPVGTVHGYLPSTSTRTISESESHP